MNALVDLLACPLCKLGLDELQARAMEYSIYFMLTLLYSLAGIFGYKVIRMMNREERELKKKENLTATPPAPRARPAEHAPEPEPEEVDSTKK
ncbi:MAG TPA: hypothetical protein VMU54_00075 [Planctomycetota bacterium]|nr:hypothetical protein [Planctomycetota bacterium]